MKKIHHIIIGNRRTTVTIEDGFWVALEEIAASLKTTRIALIRLAAKTTKPGHLASALRLFVLRHYQERSKHAVKVPR